MNDFILRDIRIGEYTVDIKLNIKGLAIIRGQIKVDDLDVGFSCSEGETVNCNEASLEMLNNPAVQGFLKKLTEEVSFKPTKGTTDVESKLSAQTHDRHEQQAQRAQEMRRQQDEAVMKMLQRVADQLDRLARH